MLPVKVNSQVEWFFGSVLGDPAPLDVVLTPADLTFSPPPLILTHMIDPTRAKFWWQVLAGVIGFGVFSLVQCVFEVMRD